MIEEYRSKFEKQSLGYTLPKISYTKYLKNLKHFEKSGDTFIAIPIKNQEANISEVLEKVEQNIGTPYILGLLFDNCTDKSQEIALRYLENAIQDSQVLVEVHLISSDLDLFESTCENLLFLFCRTRYFVTLQADIFFADSTFMPRARKAFREIPGLFGLSGRAVVSLNNPSYSESLWVRIRRSFTTSKFFSIRVTNHRSLGLFNHRLKYFGDISSFPYSRMKFTPIERNTVFLGPAIIRGPIVWDATNFMKLGGFNDLKYFLGRDDCDLSLRAQSHNLSVGYLPCNSYSPPELGTTRKPRSADVMEEMDRRSNLAASFEGSLDLYWEMHFDSHEPAEQELWKKVPIN